MTTKNDGSRQGADASAMQAAPGNTSPPPFYSVSRISASEAMDVLRAIFPTAQADDLNFVLFSTSGVHGHYGTIEDAEAHLRQPGEDTHHDVTFLVVNPRTVTLRYGNCQPKTQDDIDFLKALRLSTHQVLLDLVAGPAMRADAAPFGPPYTTDVQQCCGSPETCAEPCADLASTAVDANVVFELLRESRTAVRQLGWKSNDYGLPHEWRMLAQRYERGDFQAAMDWINAVSEYVFDSHLETSEATLRRDSATPPAIELARHIPPARVFDAVTVSGTGILMASLSGAIRHIPDSEWRSPDVPMPQRLALLHGLLNPQDNGTLCRYEDAIAYADAKCAALLSAIPAEGVIGAVWKEAAQQAAAERNAANEHRSRAITERGRFEYALRVLRPDLYERIRAEAYSHPVVENDHAQFEAWAASLHSPVDAGGCAPPVVVAPQTAPDMSKSWPERDYMCVCSQCGASFIGWKRQAVCKACSPAAGPREGVDVEELARWCDEQSKDPDNTDGAVTLLVIAQTLRSLASAQRASEDEVIACDVRVAPATTYRAGVRLSSVIAGIRMRADWDGQPFRFSRDAQPINLEPRPAFGPPYTLDVPQCCESPETCPEPCAPPCDPRDAADAFAYMLSGLDPALMGVDLASGPDETVVARWNPPAIPAGTREAAMVVIERDQHGKPTVWCDPEIVDLVGALNASGLRTIASCSGHGGPFGFITLADGRELLILPNWESIRLAERVLAAAFSGADAPIAPAAAIANFPERPDSSFSLPPGYVPIDSPPPPRDQTVVYWHKQADGDGFPAIADEWRDEHHAELALGWHPEASGFAQPRGQEG